MFINVYTISILFSILFLVIVLELVRKDKLEERYSILWIFMSVLLIILSLSPAVMEAIAGWLDIKNPPSLLFLFGLVYLLIYNLHITTVVSKQSKRITRLAQEIAILRREKGGSKRQHGYC